MIPEKRYLAEPDERRGPSFRAVSTCTVCQSVRGAESHRKPSVCGSSVTRAAGLTNRRDCLTPPATATVDSNPTGKRRRCESSTGPRDGIRTHTNERIVPNVKFDLFGTIGAKFTVRRGRYRRQQTVFSTRLGFVHRHRFVCHRRCESRNGFSSGMLWVI
jgi:hypothetical protein